MSLVEEPEIDLKVRIGKIKDQMGKLLTELTELRMEQLAEEEDEILERRGALLNWVAIVEYQTLEDAETDISGAYTFRPEMQSRAATLGLCVLAQEAWS